MRIAFFALPPALAGLLVLAWWLGAGGLSGARAWALLVWPVCAGVAMWGVATASLQGRLEWDGLQWRWSPAGGASEMGQVVVRLDWQRGLLVEFLPQRGRRTWLWMEQSAAPMFWDPFRRAVYSTRAEGQTSVTAPGAP